MTGLAITNEYPGLKKGDKLFAVITPGTPGSCTRTYRPKPYFVLETTIEEVKQAGGEDRRLYVDAPFILKPGRVCLGLDEAKKRLVKIFAEQTEGTLEIGKVRLVSADEHRAGTKIEDSHFGRSLEYA